ncbi:MAG: HEAT repeat domain-containing protein [Candidatus Thiodiazotropha sp. (ex Dulcina madagascariensis)]|nr:HEAT repeat domain-containing protein [Candidatus Thiodiazotropha sp. (ex Dulcina madagascariensis)]MCU7926930.1 HEAT repeat domain-containing protein [Candidatus Thiodiazotropha sp. (ex Dulcina madagascariensis)]
MSLQNETVDVLCELLQSGDEADRCYAARTLGVLRSHSAVPHLIERLKDEDVDVCVDAAEALGKIGDESAVPALTDSLKNDTCGEVCSMVTEALGKIASADSVEVLVKVLTERPQGLEWDGDWDTWWDIQLEAVKALGAAGAEEVVDSLVDFINDDAQQDIENEVLGALVSISGVGLDRVIERLRDQSSKALHRRRAVRALAGSKSSKATKVLGRSLQDSDPEVRVEAAQALANQKAEHYLSALLLLLRDPSEEVRNAAIKAVTQLAGQVTDSGGLRKTLLPMLTDPSSQVRATLLNTLVPVVGGNPLSDDDFKVVIASTADASAETATAACRLLGENNNPDAISTLLEHVKNSEGHPMVRREAILAIGQLGQITDEIIDSLMNAVGDSQQPVRLAALTTLMALDAQCVEVDSAEAKEVFRRPLSIIIDAVSGSIRVPEKSKSEIVSEDAGVAQQQLDAASERTVQNGVVVEFDTDTEKHFPETKADPEIDENPIPQEIAKTIKLPDTPARIVEVGEVSPTISTLDAIAMENVETMLDKDKATQEAAEMDETTQEYLDVVEANKAEMRRIRASRRITPDQDVRRLGARVLAAANDDTAIEALIQALSDEDDLMRREAAEAIGEIAQRNRDNPKLMDAVGILITQLAVGDLEQKIACARSLSFLGNRSALAPLMEALNDKQANVRIEAIQSLARLSCDSLDPTVAGHMVVRDVPSTGVARRLLECLDDDSIGVRVAATRGLSKVLPVTRDETLTQRAVERIVASVSEFTGEEARLIGQALRAFDTSLSNRALLTQLKTAEDSVKRSVFIEMIEEILNPDQGQPEQAA